MGKNKKKRSRKIRQALFMITFYISAVAWLMAGIMTATTLK